MKGSATTKKSVKSPVSNSPQKSIKKPNSQIENENIPIERPITYLGRNIK
jgi:hypothetical protein